MSYAGSKTSLPELKKEKPNSFNCSILQKNKIKKILLDVKPDFLMHLAAETHVDRSIKGQEFIETNILGTFNLLEASRN